MEKVAEVSYGDQSHPLVAAGIFIGVPDDKHVRVTSPKATKRIQELMKETGSLRRAATAYQKEFPDHFVTTAWKHEAPPGATGILGKLLGSKSTPQKDFEERKANPRIFVRTGPVASGFQTAFYKEVSRGYYDDELHKLHVTDKTVYASAPEVPMTLCSKLAGTINVSDFDRFNDAFADPKVRELVEKNATVSGLLLDLFSEPPMTAEEMHRAAVKVASAQSLDVIQIVPDGYGYRVKFAAAPAGMAPQEVQMSQEQAQQALPQEALQEADQQGVATLTNVEANPDPLQESIQPVTGFGLYKVFEAGTGKQIIGYVIPGLYDPQQGTTQQSLFVNGGQYSLQPSIQGVLVGLNFNLPESPNVRGLGCFYKTDGKALFATVPFTVISEVTVEGNSYYAAQTAMGEEVQITMSEGMKAPTMSGPGQIVIPSDFKFMTLDNPIQLEGAQAAQGQPEQMMERQASARESCGTIRAWDGGCMLSGPVFEKLGSGSQSWVDGIFWLAATGVPQNLSIDVLKQASSSGKAISLYGLHKLSSVEDDVKAAMSKAASDLLALPRLPQRHCLLKEAAAISFYSKEGSAIADASSVDAVLSLNFVNPENISTFLEALPQLEDAQTKLASLVLATQLGLSQVPQNAVVRAMQSMEDVIQGLKSLQHEAA